MQSTHTTIVTRAGRTLAGTTLLVGIALGAASIAGASPQWDPDGYSACVKEHGPTAVCCEFYGGHQDPTDTFCEQEENVRLPPTPPPGKPGLTPIPRAPSNSVG